MDCVCRDNDPCVFHGSHSEPKSHNVSEMATDARAAVLREALDAVPQDICTHDGCDKESTCPLTRVNVAINALLSPTKAG